MTLYNKLINKIPIKTVGVWKKDICWSSYTFIPIFESIGKLHYLPVPVGKNNCVVNKFAFSNKIYDLVKEVKPDLVYCYLNSKQMAVEPLLKIKNSGIPIINISVDDTQKFSLVKNIAHVFTLTMTSTKEAVVQYEKNNAKAIYLPETVNDNAYIHQDIKKDIDVSFIGGKFGNRSLIVKALQQEGLKVVVRGNRWLQGKVSFEQMINIYNRSKIVLGFSRPSSKPQLFAIKGRDFEVPMCGSFYLCEYNPALDEWFEPNKEFVSWKDLPDLINKIKYYLSNATLRETIAHAGYLRAKTEHTWTNRFKVLFKYLNQISAHPLKE